MVIQYILLEILIGAMLLGFIGAYKKRLRDRIVLLLTVPLAFIGAIFLTTGPLFDLLSDLLTDFLQSNGGGTFSGAILNLTLGVGAAAVRPIVATVLFWVLLFLLRIIIGMLLAILHLITGEHRKTKKAKRNKVPKPLWNKIGTGAVGAFSGFLIVMLSMLPLVYVNNLAEPAVNAALSEENEGTYVNSLAKTVSENNLLLTEDTMFGKIQTITGMRTLTNKALDSLTDAKVSFENEKEIEFNFTEVVSTIGETGVRAMAAYEQSCKATGTLQNFAPMATLFQKLSENDAIVNVTYYLYDEMKVTIFGTEEPPYTVDSPDDLRSDLSAAAALVNLLATDMANVSADTEDLLPELLTYLEDEPSAQNLVNVLAISSFYKKNFPVIMEFALGAISDQIDLPENKAEDHANFLTDMSAALSDKATGTYDPTGVDYFIKYCAENNVDVSEFKLSATGNTTLDHAYLSYLEFIVRKNSIETVFINYMLDSEKLSVTDPESGLSLAQKTLSYYVGSDKTVYVCDSQGDWSIFNGSISELRKSSYAAQLLANRVNTEMTYNEDAAIDQERARAMASDAIANIYDRNSEIGKITAALLNSIADVSNYDPSGAVYREDIINSLNKEAELDEAHNNSFGTSITIMAELYGALTEEADEASIETVTNNFKLIGRLLDSMKNMESTKDIPDKMLHAIMNNKNYKSFFSSNTVQSLLKNVEEGKSTYEELFGMIQSLYGTATELLPGQS